MHTWALWYRFVVCSRPYAAPRWSAELHVGDFRSKTTNSVTKPPRTNAYHCLIPIESWTSTYYLSHWQLSPQLIIGFHILRTASITGIREFREHVISPGRHHYTDNDRNHHDDAVHHDAVSTSELKWLQPKLARQ